MNETVHIFRTVTLRPHWFQYVINEFVALCFFLGSIWVWEFCSFQYHELAKYVGIALFLYLLFKLIYLARMEYVITGGTDYHHAWCPVPLYRLRRVVQSCGLPAAQKPSTADFRTEDRNHLLW